jgi:hypothetical protein
VRILGRHVGRSRDTLMAMPVVQRKCPHTRYHSFEREGNGCIFPVAHSLLFYLFACTSIARPSSLYLSSAVTGSSFGSDYNYWPSADDELKSIVRHSCLVSFFSLPLRAFFNATHSPLSSLLCSLHYPHGMNHDAHNQHGIPRESSFSRVVSSEPHYLWF